MSKKLLNPSTFHNPVLLQPACHFLNIRPGHRYIDATLGGGGHMKEIIRLGGLVLGLDQDPEALSACPELPGLTKVQSNFIHLKEITYKYNWFPVSGIIFDLGVSAYQFETPTRGFSFQDDGPLDMRMDPSLSITAATLVNNLSINQLSSLFKDYGEIPVAKSLAAKIITARSINTTRELAKITRKWSRQAFQALRIDVNDELGAIQATLPQAFDLLESSGRLVVISFHSLEDRIVKIQFNNWAKDGLGQILTPKPIVGEKSAKLRAIQKI